MSIRFSLALAGAIALVAAAAQPSRADVTFKTEDGLLEITLPNGWHQAKKGVGENTQIHAAGHGAHVIVREHSKEDFKDLKAVATFLAGKLKKKFTDAEPKFEDMQVNNMPAVLISMEGTEPSGVKKAYLVTVVQADSMYVSITASGNAAAFAKSKQVLAGLANQLKITTASSAAPAAAPQPPAAPAPTGAKPRGATR
jgi:hypothetical protein